MLLPNRKEVYSFDIIPNQRGDFKGVITFKPGEWPVKDVDSDGEEMARAFNEEKPAQFTLWYTFDIRVQPASSQSTVELEAHVLDSTVLCVPLSNPLGKKLHFKCTINGNFLEGSESFEIQPKEKFNYELKFSPRKIGKFKGSLIFFNEETGEFWYDLKLLAIDAMPVELDPVEAEIGKYAVQKVNLKNPFDERLDFRVLISNTDHFVIENNNNNNNGLNSNNNQTDFVSVNAQSSLDVNIKFMPSTIGLGDHVSLLTFSNDRIGNLTYELKGYGLEPDTQDPLNITSEINQSQISTIYFRNTTDSAIYCDLALLDETNENKPFVEENPENPVFNILMNSMESVHVPPKAALDIPIVFSPIELKSYKLSLAISTRREARMSWDEKNKK
jgi:hypothetical protein